MKKFVATCQQALLVIDHKSLPDNLYVINQTPKTKKGVFGVQPGITTCEIEFVWCGAFYKNLIITADLVPAIRVKSWPKFVRTESELLSQDIIKQGSLFLLMRAIARARIHTRMR